MVDIVLQCENEIIVPVSVSVNVEAREFIHNKLFHTISDLK